jgi:hypothetical protein
MNSDSFNSEDGSFEEETDSKTKNDEQDLNHNLIKAIAKTLTLILEENKNLQNYKDIIQKQSKMIFSASSVPGISIIDYLERIQTYSNLEKNTLISSLIFIDRFCELSKTTLTYYNIHRILFASIIIAIKYNEDSFYDNKYYAEIAGITIEELNLIEEAFVLMSDFQFFISDDIFENYNRYLTSFKNMT